MNHRPNPAAEVNPLLLAPSDVLARMGKLDLDEMLHLGNTRRYARGAYIFHAGEADSHVYFLSQGRIKIHQLSPLGREIILWFCFSGEIFGLAEMTHGGGRVVSAQACEHSEVLCIPQDQFHAFLESHPKTALLVMQVLSCRLRVLGDMLVNLASDDVNTRLAKLILRLGARYGTRAGKEIHLNVHLTHQEMADMLGTTRQTITSVLGQLKRQGILSMDNRRILIESEELLSEMTHMT
ncbi:MAG: Crp/Fnr family transcriptional regulator [Betaproteobacteria bacterium]|nr:Crp/Fnr family transcriptional regulator [Betaproteobacteria bacterium]